MQSRSRRLLLPMAGKSKNEGVTRDEDGRDPWRSRSKDWSYERRDARDPRARFLKAMKDRVC